MHNLLNHVIQVAKDDRFTLLPDPVYELAKEIFLKTPVNEYLNDKNKDFYIGRIKNAKRLAKLFIEEFEKEDVKDLK
jgi:hypothetical protein